VTPNQPRTGQTNFRIPADLKAAAKEKAASEGKDLTTIVVRALERYVKRP
jgi:predicted HicB family RNase H-like nuclease